jgi:predicted flavoprotein YhiN
MSAKGRGNLTNTHIQPFRDYVSDDPAFVQQAFQHYKAADFLHFLTTHHIAYQEEENGRILLQSGKVAQFRDFLLEQLQEQGRTIAYEQTLQNIRKKADGTFEVQTASSTFTAKNVILATGSKSVPLLGSSDIALQIAKEHCIRYTDFYPALVGFETKEDVSSLAGSSVIGQGSLYINGNLRYQQT